MRWSCAFATTCCLAAGTARVADASYPAAAYVQSDQAEVRSGPGTEYYVTEHVAWGTKVEVHRLDPGGWAAIRPPEGSFSWVPASDLKPTDDPGLAEVVGQDVVTRVGSRESDLRDTPYVRLTAGELVELLGSEAASNPAEGASPAWYKITPPSGEFRFVRQEALSQLPPTREGKRQARSTAHEESPARGAGNRAANLPDPAGAGWSASRPSDPPAPASTAGPDAGPAPAEQSDKQQPSAGGAAGEPGLLNLAPSLPAPTVDDELNRLDLNLSLQVAQETASWQLDELRTGTAHCLAMAADPVVRHRASTLLQRIDQFLDLQRRHQAFGRENDRFQAPAELDFAATTGQPRISSSAVQPASATTVSAPQDDALGSDGATSRPSTETVSSDDAPTAVAFDAQGWLAPVISPRKEMPQYALTDADGAVVHFVSPAPGMNLHRYLRQEVGIYGQRGYMPEFGKPHLTAQRIVVLDRHRD